MLCAKSDGDLLTTCKVIVKKKTLGLFLWTWCFFVLLTYPP